MSFLNSNEEEASPGKGFELRRKRVVLELLNRFSSEFPEITYELFWDSGTVNAQAWTLRSTRYVRVYGGLIRHPALTKFGMALALAHETGHHLGGAPFDPAMPWISWQGQADYWAASIGMPKIWGDGACKATLSAAREILKLNRQAAEKFGDEDPDLSPECRDRIFRAGALGEAMPGCAMEALALARD
jgi:hypothetical protein